jgi:hypothetical protein
MLNLERPSEMVCECPAALPALTGHGLSSQLAARASRFEFQKCSQLFIRTHNETLLVAAMRVSDEDCAPVQIQAGANHQRENCFAQARDSRVWLSSASCRRFIRRPMNVDSRSAFPILSAASPRNVAA